MYTLARWFKGASLSLDGILVGGVKTYIMDSVVADSAPTATAYALKRILAIPARGMLFAVRCDLW